MKNMLVTLLSLSTVLACNNFKGTPNEILTKKEQDAKCKQINFVRNWTEHPAITTVNNFKNTLYVIGDIHGNSEILAELLIRSGIATGNFAVKDEKLATNLKWAAGNAILVQVGDVIDKGNHSLTALTILEDLQVQAAQSGGQVIALAGNHEIAFLHDVNNAKALNFIKEIKDDNKNACNDIYSTKSEHGKWLRNLNAAAKINGVFISHTGYVPQNTLAKVSSEFQQMVDLGKWRTNFACGDISKKEIGFFNGDAWWNSVGVKKTLANTEAKQVIFGHDPGAFKDRGNIIGFGDSSSNIIKLDVEMWAEVDSRGALYRCATWNADGSCALNEFFANPKHEKDPITIPQFSPVPIKTGEPPNQKPSAPENEC